MPSIPHRAKQPTGPANSAAPNSCDAGGPNASGPFFQPSDWLSLGFTVLGAVVIYLATLAPEVTLEYSGFVSTSANYAGVTYPPGYPVWTLYSWLFVKLLPFSNIACRVAGGSAVAAALACGLVALIVSRGGALLLDNSPAYTYLNALDQKRLRIVCGFVAGMAFGLSRTVWRMAVVAETWAVTVLLFAIALGLLMYWVARPNRRGCLYTALFVFGLLLTSNQELVVMLPALLAFVALGNKQLGRDLSLPIGLLAGTGWVLSQFGRFPWLAWLPLVTCVAGVSAGVVIIFQTGRFGSEWKSAALCVALVLLGLACYFYLPLASMTNPPANWAYPRTVEGFFHAITRGQWVQPHPTDQLLRFARQLWMLAKQTSSGLGWPYLLLTPLPFCLFPVTVRIASKWLVALAAALICAGPCVMAWLNPEQDRSTVDLSASYFSVMFLVLALCAGLGLMILGSAILRLSRSRSSA